MNNQKNTHDYTPGSVHDLICETIEQSIETQDSIRVVGEVANLLDNRKESGWMFFYLKDITNSVRCVVPPKVSEKLDFNLKEGARIIVEGKLWLYRKEAKVELLLNSIKPIKTLAERIHTDPIIKKLDDEGVLRKAQLKSIPTNPPPSRFAIISPKNSSAPVDIRAGATGTGELTFLVRYTEDDEPETLIEEINKCNRHNDELDAIIITKGGGGDLSIYDNEEVLRTVANSELPVISAVGHPADNTLLDFVAVESRPTSTLAGQWLREIHRNYKHNRQIERKQIITLSIVVLLIVVVMIVLWGLGVFGK